MVSGPSPDPRARWRSLPPVASCPPSVARRRFPARRAITGLRRRLPSHEPLPRAVARSSVFGGVDVATLAVRPRGLPRGGSFGRPLGAQVPVTFRPPVTASRWAAGQAARVAGSPRFPTGSAPGPSGSAPGRPGRRRRFPTAGVDPAARRSAAPGAGASTTPRAPALTPASGRRLWLSPMSSTPSTSVTDAPAGRHRRSGSPSAATRGNPTAWITARQLPRAATSRLGRVRRGTQPWPSVPQSPDPAGSRSPSTRTGSGGAEAAVVADDRRRVGHGGPWDAAVSRSEPRPAGPITASMSSPTSVLGDRAAPTTAPSRAGRHSAGRGGRRLVQRLSDARSIRRPRLPRGAAAGVPAPIPTPPIGGRPLSELPVGGGPAAVEEAARRAIEETVAGLPSRALTHEAAEALSDPSRARQRIGQGVPPAGDEVLGALRAVARNGDAIGQRLQPASATAAGVREASFGGAQADRTSRPPTSWPGHRGDVAGTANGPEDPDGRLGLLVEALEDRFLLETERRGGRWRGEF
jgi:hypothetical protein